MEIFYFLTKYIKSRLLQNCRMRERVKGENSSFEQNLIFKHIQCKLIFKCLLCTILKFNYFIINPFLLWTRFSSSVNLVHTEQNSIIKNVSSHGILKLLWRKNKLLILCKFSFCHNVFNLILCLSNHL